MEDLVSIIIPSRNEKYLEVTLKDLLAKAKGPIEIIVVVEGEPFPKEVPGVRYVYHKEATGMKYAINDGVAVSKGKYIMKIDAHCIVAEGFDQVLREHHRPDWIQIPRRYKLIENGWKVNFNEWVDYEYYIFPIKYPIPSLHGFNWRERTKALGDVKIDDTLTFQGSFWFMTREHWDRHKFMTDEGYNQLHAQEAAYIGNATWMGGGRVVVNKHTWYAHLYKTKQGGRGYHMDDKQRRACYVYSYKHWVEDNKDGFIKLIEQFWPLPGWPKDWKEKMYGTTGK